jgi:hypothetical protein
MGEQWSHGGRIEVRDRAFGIVQRPNDRPASSKGDLAVRRNLLQPGGQGHRGVEGVLRDIRPGAFFGIAFWNWPIQENGYHPIGLFHGVFERKAQSFYPCWASDANPLEDLTDRRKHQRQLSAHGISRIVEADEATSGPPHFAAIDPDGNTILIAQHDQTSARI